jgi:hypothetical protein
MLGRKWLGALICLLLAGGFFSFGYWQGERSLQPQLQALTAQVADSRQGPGNPWTGAGALHPPMPFMPGAGIPANASPELKEFLQNRQTLMQKMAELRQQNPNANPQDLQARFRQQNEALFQRQQQLAQKLGQENSHNVLPAPPPLQIPANASPQMKDYLTARDQLMRDQVAFMNQHRTDDPPARQAAMQQWRQQNADRLQQIQQLAQAMAQTTVATTPTPPTTSTTK